MHSNIDDESIFSYDREHDNIIGYNNINNNKNNNINNNNNKLSKYCRRKRENSSEENIIERIERGDRGERDASSEGCEENGLMFEYICIYLLERNVILSYHSYFNSEIKNYANALIKKIGNNAKKKLSAGSKKTLRWNNRIIYLMVCNEKKLLLFLIGHDKNVYFKYDAYKYLNELKIYTRSELYYNSNACLYNISNSTLHSLNHYMRRLIDNLNRICSNEQIVAVKKKMYKINTVMNNHIDSLYQSKGDITALQQKTDYMSKNTVNFLQNSKKLKRAMFLKYWKTYFIIACCFLVGIKVYRTL